MQGRRLGDAELGEMVVARRERMGMGSPALAAAAGVSRKAVWLVERGRASEVSRGKLEAILSCVGLTQQVSDRPGAYVVPEPPKSERYLLARSMLDRLWGVGCSCRKGLPERAGN